ncbi:cysteine dioxygenase family protein [Actinomadura alba]|uniref:Cysteine dioxygenase family protein n=1 Tax=Actinomadura alba TaxID=406431 RepID=A0ABR7LJF2_9ACTN|nr:cysteine dioxygenase family protein [Actinomadura alba]MBC6464946.1 cysteine dioxygenase family protein [Actinomadura alba]
MTLNGSVIARPGLEHLVGGVRAAVDRHAGWQRTASLVAGVLEERLPGPDILTVEEQTGDPAGYQSHLLHVEPDGSFSVLAVVWRTGQVTAIHDHVTWCVVGVLRGVEHEERFECPTGDHLVRVGESANAEGSVTGFAPPGDIHRVCNPNQLTTISLHVYGTDVSRIGSSVRREYDLPIRSAGR